VSKPLQVLYDEHRSIAAVLDALLQLLREVRRGKPVDQRVFHQILYYLDVFPERHHHPKEDEALFRAVRSRTDEADAAIRQLEQQHGAGATAVGTLAQLLNRWQGGEPVDTFDRACADFVARYREHMRLEEEVLMPIAQRVLQPADWAAVEAEFARHDDPLRGVAQGDDPREMYRRILYLAPPPIGLGDPL
jgi:hemerythrin-like domain-containing protein